MKLQGIAGLAFDLYQMDLAIKSYYSCKKFIPLIFFFENLSSLFTIKYIGLWIFAVMIYYKAALVHLDTSLVHGPVTENKEIYMHMKDHCMPYVNKWSIILFIEYFINNFGCYPPSLFTCYCGTTSSHISVTSKIETYNKSEIAVGNNSKLVFISTYPCQKQITAIHQHCYQPLLLCWSNS